MSDSYMVVFKGINSLKLLFHHFLFPSNYHSLRLLCLFLPMPSKIPFVAFLTFGYRATLLLSIIGTFHTAQKPINSHSKKGQPLASLILLTFVVVFDEFLNYVIGLNEFQAILKTFSFDFIGQSLRSRPGFINCSRYG